MTKRIVLMCAADFIEPFKKQGFDVLWTLDLVYPLFYEGRQRVSLAPEAFRERLEQYKTRVLEFNPRYFMADSGFFSGILNRLDFIKKSDMSALWAGFIKDLNKIGVITIVSCVDDPWQYNTDKRFIRPIRDAFRIVKNNTMQLEPVFKRKGQKVIYFPDYVRMDSPEVYPEKEDPLLADKIQKGVLGFDVFFTGRMDLNRKIFFRGLSRRLKGLDYFFGNSGFYYTSRKAVDFDPFNGAHLARIYRNCAVNIVYGSINEFFFNKTWAVSDRIFNIAYCGGFFLTDYRRHLADLFEPDPALYSFRTLNECRRKVGYYLENKKQRLEMADKFHTETLVRHTADKRIEQFARELEGMR